MLDLLPALRTSAGEGAPGNLTDADVLELSLVPSIHELRTTIDDFTTGLRVPADDPTIKAFAQVLWIAISDVGGNWSRIEREDALQDVLLDATNILFKFIQNGTHTAAGFRAYIKGAIHNKLSDKAAKEKRNARVEQPLQLEPVEHFHGHSAPELLGKFKRFFDQLQPADRRILTPAAFVDAPVEQWAGNIFDLLRSDSAEVGDRINQLSDEWNVHPLDVVVRQRKLYCLLQDYLEKGEDAFFPYEHGPKWLRASASRPDETGIDPKHNPIATASDRRSGSGTDGVSSGKRTDRPRRRDATAWGCKEHSRANAATLRHFN